MHMTSLPKWMFHQLLTLIPMNPNSFWYKWNFNPTKLFHTIVTTDFHFTFIHSLVLPWFSTHLTLSFIKTSYSWLFHITKIYTLESIVKNSKSMITIHFIIFWYYKSLCFFVLLKTWIKITTESHVLLKKIKTTIKICGI
jgi:hypothetical protein